MIKIQDADKKQNEVLILEYKQCASVASRSGNIVNTRHWKEKADELSGLYFLLIPEMMPEDSENPAYWIYGIEPGWYSESEVIELIKANRTNRHVLRFIAEMLEEESS